MELDIASAVAVELLREEGINPTEEEIKELVRCGIFATKEGTK